MEKRHILIILDGYGIAEDPSVSAIDRAEKPFLDGLFEKYPHGRLQASGLAVGLPEGQMGNSEVGHTNLGAGRVVYQEITRIDKAIEGGAFSKNEELVAAVEHAHRHGTKLHLMGLFSDGGVHASLDHLYALLELAKAKGLQEAQVGVHAFTDGRDTDPHAGAGYAERFKERAEEIGVGRIVSVVGRYYAMDRDRRWERTKKAYDLLVHGEGDVFGDPVEAIEASYADDVTDEFIEPRRIDYEGDEATFGEHGTRIESGDAVVFYNFRADRARQITRALTDPDFDGFDRGDGRPTDLHYVTFTPYDADFGHAVAFQKLNLDDTLGQVISERGGGAAPGRRDGEVPPRHLLLQRRTRRPVRGGGAHPRPLAEGRHLRPPARDERARARREGGGGACRGDV